MRATRPRSSPAFGHAHLTVELAVARCGLEILRTLQRGGRLSQADSGYISAFLRRFARDVLLPPTGKKSMTALAETIRQNAADMAARRADTETLQAAASLRVIAAALDDYPAFFGRVSS